MAARELLDIECVDRLLKAMLVFSRTVSHVLESRAVEDAIGPLSKPRVQVLRLLGQRGAHSATQIAHYLGVSKPAVTHVIESMVRDRLVIRTTSSRDRRGVELTLSKKGRSVLRDVRKEQRHLIRNATREVNESHAVAWARALEEITGALAKADRTYRSFCLQCGAHADGTCILVGGGADCLFLRHERKSRTVESKELTRTIRPHR